MRRWQTQTPGTATPARLDARVEIAALLIWTVAVFAMRSGVSLACALALSGASLVAARVRPRMAWRALRASVVVLGFALMASALVVDGTADLPLVASVGLSRAGLARGAASVTRIVCLVLATTSVAATTTAAQVAEVLVGLLRPLGRLGVPIRGLSLAVTVALQSLSVVLDAFRDIAAAQRARGLRLDEGPATRRVAGYASVLVSLVYGQLSRADDLARAFRDRCYDGELTDMGARLTWRDCLTLALVLVASLVLACA